MTDYPNENKPAQVAIVPCSGIGKTYGTVTREAAYIVVEDLAPETTRLVPLSLLVLGDEEAQAAVRGAPVITLDGCKLACATVNVGEAGGRVARGFTVLDCYRRNKQCKPKGIAELNEGGLALAQALAEEVMQAVNELPETNET
ncbi:MAG: putative zinc-binding protein [Caldilineales bacterium]